MQVSRLKNIVDGYEQCEESKESSKVGIESPENAPFFMVSERSDLCERLRLRAIQHPRFACVSAAAAGYIPRTRCLFDCICATTAVAVSVLDGAGAPALPRGDTNVRHSSIFLFLFSLSSLSPRPLLSKSVWGVPSCPPLLVRGARVIAVSSGKSPVRAAPSPGRAPLCAVVWSDVGGGFSQLRIQGAISSLIIRRY